MRRRSSRRIHVRVPVSLLPAPRSPLPVRRPPSPDYQRISYTTPDNRGQPPPQPSRSLKSPGEGTQNGGREVGDAEAFGDHDTRRRHGDAGDDAARGGGPL